MKWSRRHKHLHVLVFLLVHSVINAVPASKDDASRDAAKNEGHDHVFSQLHDSLDKSVQKSKLTNGNSANSETEVTTTSDVAHQHFISRMFHNTEHSVRKTEAGAGGKTSASNEGKGSEKPNEGHQQVVDTVKGHVVGSVAKSSAKGRTEQDSSTSPSSSESNQGHAHVIGQITGHLDSTAKNTNSTTAHEHIIDKIAGSVHETVKNTSEEKCTLPAIEQFPHPIMSPSTRRHGGLIVHIIVAMYMFIGLAIVCDEYFVASLDRICEELKMSPDVAGATFMAAGSSAPELAIVIIGVFLAKDDIGISGVIGSAVFNIMFVIACCGLCQTAVVYLNWWPLVRDCFFYAVSILVMLVVIYDERITWVESLVMLITYLIYCVVLRFNAPLERYAQTLPVPFKHKVPTEQSGLVSYKTLDDDGKLPNYGMEWSPDKQQQQAAAEDSLQNFGMEWSPEKHQQGFASQLSGPDLNQATRNASPPAAPAPAAAAAPKPIAQQEYYKPKEYDPSTKVDPLVKPEGGLYAQASWITVYPIHWLCRKTMPDCRSEKYKNWYPLTFFLSMVWISFYSYFMVWMITIIGYTMGIPDTVMGLTFVAAGVSVPDALSSIAVVREGYGDMAVSNAVGSNVFDILICLGLPWFINTAIVKPGSTVKVISKGLTYSTLSLLSTVVFLLVATHLNGWKLDRRYGIILLVWYLIFITLASMYELNVFARWNPVECPSEY